jgi:hypothetical protein
MQSTMLAAGLILTVAIAPLASRSAIGAPDKR